MPCARGPRCEAADRLDIAEPTRCASDRGGRAGLSRRPLLFLGSHYSTLSLATWYLRCLNFSSFQAGGLTK